MTLLLFWAQAPPALDNVWVVLGLFSVQQAFFAVNQPTRAAIIPRLLPGEQLPAANSLNMTVVQFGAIVGPLLAGVLIPSGRAGHLYLIDTVLLVATLWDGAGAAPRCRRRERDTKRAGLACGAGRVPLPVDAEGAAGLVRGGHRRDGVRHAAGAVPADRQRDLRRTR